MKIKLTKEQKKHLKSIQWLLDPICNRRSGRTTLLAYVLIDIVLSTKMTVTLKDHYPNRMADLVLKKTVEQIIQENELPLKINHSCLELSYNHPISSRR